MKKLALVFVALGLVGLIDINAAVAEDHQMIDGNGGVAGASTFTFAVTPNGAIVECTNVTSCGGFIATAPAGSSGAQVSHVTVPTANDIESICINSPLCTAFLGH